MDFYSIESYSLIGVEGIIVLLTLHQIFTATMQKLQLGKGKFALLYGTLGSAIIGLLEAFDPHDKFAIYGPLGLSRLFFNLRIFVLVTAICRYIYFAFISYYEISNANTPTYIRYVFLICLPIFNFISGISTVIPEMLGIYQFFGIYLILVMIANSTVCSTMTYSYCCLKQLLIKHIQRMKGLQDSDYVSKSLRNLTRFVYMVIYLCLSSLVCELVLVYFSLRFDLRGPNTTLQYSWPIVAFIYILVFAEMLFLAYSWNFEPSSRPVSRHGSEAGIEVSTHRHSTRNSVVSPRTSVVSPRSTLVKHPNSSPRISINESGSVFRWKFPFLFRKSSVENRRSSSERTQRYRSQPRIVVTHAIHSVAARTEDVPKTPGSPTSDKEEVKTPKSSSPKTSTPKFRITISPKSAVTATPSPKNIDSSPKDPAHLSPSLGSRRHSTENIHPFLQPQSIPKHIPLPAPPSPQITSLSNTTPPLSPLESSRPPSGSNSVSNSGPSTPKLEPACELAVMDSSNTYRHLSKNQESPSAPPSLNPSPSHSDNPFIIHTETNHNDDQLEMFEITTSN